MARTISDEEHQLKRRARRRLIGAIVLVTAIVVVLPMVLDSEPKPVGREISVSIPSPDAGPFAGQIAPLPAQKDGKKAAKGSESAPAAEGKASAAAPQQEALKESAPAAEAKPAKAAPRKEPAKPRPKPKPKPARAGEGQFVVQVIALADADKARQMQERIAAAGIKSYTEIVKTAKGDVTRVRAGPFATRDAAEKAREQLKTLGMSGNITSR